MSQSIYVYKWYTFDQLGAEDDGGAGGGEDAVDQGLAAQVEVDERGNHANLAAAQPGPCTHTRVNTVFPRGLVPFYIVYFVKQITKTTSLSNRFRSAIIHYIDIHIGM